MKSRCVYAKLYNVSFPLVSACVRVCECACSHRHNYNSAGVWRNLPDFHFHLILFLLCFLFLSLFLSLSFLSRGFSPGFIFTWQAQYLKDHILCTFVWQQALIMLLWRIYLFTCCFWRRRFGNETPRNIQIFFFLLLFFVALFDRN